MNTDTLDFSDYDEQSQIEMQKLSFLKVEDLKKDALSSNPLDKIRTTKSEREIFNEIALEYPRGKDSLIYKARVGTFRAFLENKNLYEQAKQVFNEIDLENIILSSKNEIIDDLPFFCNTSPKLKIIQHIANSNYEEYIAKFIDVNSKKLTTYLDNFTWFIEGNESNQITFHFFVDNNQIKEIICTMGSDIFDCLKISTNLNATGGFTIEIGGGEYQVNAVLKDFIESITKRVENFYYKNDTIFTEKFHIPRNKIVEALKQEFIAEGDYQRTVDWIFDKIGVTTTFKYFVNQFKENSKEIKSYRIDESRYLPFHPNFDPIFNDTLLKSFGINPNIKIEEYFKFLFIDDTEDIKKFQLQEKEVNWVYGYNAGFCGLWNAIIDTVDGFIEIIPSLYEVFTDRATFKQFLHFINEFLEHITELMDKIEEWELKNASYSVYRYEYTESYAIGILLSLFIPMPKTALGGKSSESLKFFTKTVTTIVESEVILLAYRLGLRIEKTAAEWKLIFNDIVISTGSKEKVAQRLENIIKITSKRPNFVFKLIPEYKLKKLIDFKKGRGLGIFRESDRLLIQSKLFNANIAVAEFKVSFKGKTIIKQLKAYSGSTIKELNPNEWAKPADFRSGEKMQDFVEITESGPTRRFQDTESKIFREFEDIHLKDIMRKMGAKSADELRISVELQTILDPCSVCQGQMSKFQKLYNAEIKIYSSGAKDGFALKNLYPKFKVNNPKK